MRHNMIQLLLTKYEVDLVQDFTEIGYGEVTNVHLPINEKPEINYFLSSQTHNLVKELRSYGYFDKIIIHDGHPVSAEIQTYTQSGRAYLKKLRFQ